jgi:hypothetical protein
VLPLTTRDPRRLLDDEAADMAIGYFRRAGRSDGARQAGGPWPMTAAPVRRRVRVRDARDHPLASGPLAATARRAICWSASGPPFGFIDEALASLGRGAHRADRQPVLHRGRVVANSIC